MKLSSSNAASSPMPEDRLRAQLRAEALAGTPAFSHELHQRTMAVLRGNGLQGLGADPRANESRWRIVWKVAAPLAVAAAVAIAGWIVLVPPVPSQNAPETVAVEYMPSPPQPSNLVQNVAQSLGLPTDDSLEEVKYGHLDEDAQRLASFVADQLPTFGLTDDSPQPPAPQ